MKYENRDKINSAFHVIDQCEQKIQLLDYLDDYIKSSLGYPHISLTFSMSDGIKPYTIIDLSDNLELVKNLRVAYKEILEFKIREAKDILKEL